MKTVTIVSTWEAETEVELTDDEYVEFVASGDPPDEVLDTMPPLFHTDGAVLVDWKRKQDEPPNANNPDHGPG